MNGKGDKRRPENKSAIDANWDRIFGKKTQMWEHTCPVDGLMSVESGAECNWCGATEQGETDDLR